MWPSLSIIQTRQSQREASCLSSIGKHPQISASNDSKKQSTSIPTWFQPLLGPLYHFVLILFSKSPPCTNVQYIDDCQQVSFSIFSVTFLSCSLDICVTFSSVSPGFLLWHLPHQQHVTICITAPCPLLSSKGCRPFSFDVNGFWGSVGLGER